MAHTKREVWEAAKRAGIDDFISKVSEAFGPNVIDGVMIESPEGKFTTDDRLLFDPDRVKPGYRISKEQVKEARVVRISRMK